MLPGFICASFLSGYEILLPASWIFLISSHAKWYFTADHIRLCKLCSSSTVFGWKVFANLPFPSSLTRVYSLTEKQLALCTQMGMVGDEECQSMADSGTLISLSCKNHLCNFMLALVQSWIKSTAGFLLSLVTQTCSYRRCKPSAEKLGGYFHVFMVAHLVHSDFLAFLDTTSIHLQYIRVSMTWVWNIMAAVKWCRESSICCFIFPGWLFLIE